MRIKITAILFLIVIVISLLGCDKSVDDIEVPNEDSVYEYTQESARIDDICGSGWLVNGSLAVVSVGENTYRFDNKISEENRADFIKAQEDICKLLNKNGVEAKELQFYVLKGIESRAVGADKSFYIDFSETKSIQQVSLTLQAIWGEYTNYGYLFALSTYVAEDLGWIQNNDVSLDIEIFNQDPILLNLVYPAFSEKYSSEVQISACKSLAQNILSSMDNYYSGEDIFKNKLQEFISQKEIDFKSTYLTFAYGGGNCPVKLKTRYLEVYLDSDHEGSCTLTEKSKKEDPMFNLSLMIDFFEYADKDISDVRNRFLSAPEDLIPVYVKPINKSFAGGGEVGGMFVPNGGSSYIELDSIYTITHEYTHYIDYCVDDNTDDINWCAETLACYYGKNMSFISRYVRGSAGDTSVYSIEDLSKIIGQDYDSTEDEILFQNIMSSREENKSYALISLYKGRLSFGDYFVKTYGDEKFIECMLSPNSSKAIVGKEIAEIIDDWCEWLEQFKTA